MPGRGGDAVLLRPDTFMNRSGESVQTALHFFKADPDALLVAHDDVELDFGTAGFKRGGGLAGHNGLRSIAGSIGTRDFLRFRLGIGRPLRGEVASHVLGKFTEAESGLLPDFLDRAWALLEGGLQDIEKAVRDQAKIRLLEG
ncbi:MAG TPA: peptidyl-tRNA hydrolase [bacterium]|nr:peptidyl-tRNA hydrolase [bacterium]